MWVVPHHFIMCADFYSFHQRQDEELLHYYKDPLHATPSQTHSLPDPLPPSLTPALPFFISIIAF